MAVVILHWVIKAAESNSAEARAVPSPKSERAEPVVAEAHLIPKFAGNEKERQGLRQRAEFARMRRNS